MELTLHIELEPRLSIPEIQEFERKAKEIGKSASEIVAELIRHNFLSPSKQESAQ